MTMMTPLELRNAWVTHWTVFTQPTPQCIHYIENDDDINEVDGDDDNLDDNSSDHGQDNYHKQDDTHQIIWVIFGLIGQFWVPLGHIGHIGHIGHSGPLWATGSIWATLGHCFRSIWDSLDIWIF